MRVTVQVPSALRNTRGAAVAAGHRCALIVTGALPPTGACARLWTLTVSCPKASVVASGLRLAASVAPVNERRRHPNDVVGVRQRVARRFGRCAAIVTLLVGSPSDAMSGTLAVTPVRSLNSARSCLSRALATRPLVSRAECPRRWSCKSTCSSVGRHTALRRAGHRCVGHVAHAVVATIVNCHRDRGAPANAVNSRGRPIEVTHVASTAAAR